MDECILGTHGCNQTCINSIGSYNCQCREGFILAADQRDCDGKSLINHIFWHNLFIKAIDRTIIRVGTSKFSICRILTASY